MRRRKGQRDAVDGKHRQILAQENFEIRGRQREEQLICPELLLVRPGTHRDGRDQEEQQHRIAVAQLVQVGGVIGEELRAECQQPAGHHERDDEQIPQNAGEVTGDVPAKNGKDDSPSRHASTPDQSRRGPGQLRHGAGDALAEFSKTIARCRSARGTVCPCRADRRPSRPPTRQTRSALR